MTHNRKRLTLRAERGIPPNDDRQVGAYMTDTHMVIRIGETSHLFRLPDLDEDGSVADVCCPEVTQGIEETSVDIEDVIEGDGFLISFADNLPSGVPAMYITKGPDDWIFECDGLASTGVYRASRR